MENENFNEAENPALQQGAVTGSATPKVGDYIRGSWRDEATGKTFYTEGTVREYPAGLFVQFEDEGITPLKCFFHFSEIRHCQ